MTTDPSIGWLIDRLSVQRPKASEGAVRIESSLKVEFQLNSLAEGRGSTIVIDLTIASNAAVIIRGGVVCFVSYVYIMVGSGW